MADLVFLYPAWLWALLPLLIILPWLKNTSRSSKLIASHLAVLFSKQSEKPKTGMLVLLALAWILAIIALAAPSFKKQNMPVFSLSSARVLIMDMSLSMHAKDIVPSRLQQAKYKALDMLPGFDEGSTALVAYAADGYVVSPLTQDAATLKNLIPELSPEIMPIAGSNAAAGVEVALKLLTQAGFASGDLILVSDEISNDEARDILALVKNKDYRLSILAIGTEQGAPIPVDGGKLLTENGKTVIAKLDLVPMAKVTQNTGGILQPWLPTNTDVDNLIALNKLPISSNTKSADKKVSERVNQGFWLIIPLVIFALAGFRKGVVIVLAMVIVPVPVIFASPFKTSDQQGFDAFQSGDYAKAAENFDSLKWKGVAQYNAGNYQGAIDSLSNQQDPTSLYNLGNALAQNGEYQKALETYEALLKAVPSHEDAKKNAEIVKKALEQQQSQQGENQQKDDKNASQEDKDAQQQSKDGADNQNPAQNSNEQSNEKSSEPTTSEQNENKEADQNQEDKKNKDAQPSAEQADDKDAENKAQSPKEQAEEQKELEQANQASQSDENGLAKSNPILKKLEQVPNGTAELIRAQLLLQAREKSQEPKTQKAW